MRKLLAGSYCWKIVQGMIITGGLSVITVETNRTAIKSNTQHSFLLSFFLFRISYCLRITNPHIFHNLRPITSPGNRVGCGRKLEGDSLWLGKQEGQCECYQLQCIYRAADV